jgi:hypothetical protein
LVEYALVSEPVREEDKSVPFRYCPPCFHSLLLLFLSISSLFQRFRLYFRIPFALKLYILPCCLPLLILSSFLSFFFTSSSYPSLSTALSAMSCSFPFIRTRSVLLSPRALPASFCSGPPRVQSCLQGFGGLTQQTQHQAVVVQNTIRRFIIVIIAQQSAHPDTRAF